MRISLHFICLLVILCISCPGCRSTAFVDVQNYVHDNYAQSSDPASSAKGIDFAVHSSNAQYAVLTEAQTPGHPGTLADTWYVICVRKTQGRWQVIYDLTRSDVPAEAELKHIRQTFPKDFPKALLPAYWQKLLNGA
ncbi:hypothetical protein HNR65_002525 [Desulfosalsimonas propionicica]|uniref:Lipoprotein n=1 Tax=Desulfosalsimonas propionicica TaxID=332175 RepID=A0A7W0HLC5_9BACT|nr:hypothetical protein [Desulfosalsimonas propionicica]MBA2882184.1 hypothetical protein [Desulfosalsimonas propionicica]